jgi:hypothetical protein
MAQKPKTKFKATQATQQVTAQPVVQESARVETPTFSPVPTTDNQAIQTYIQPHYPVWPSSKPGPQVKQPPVGMKPFNAPRREQVTEIIHQQNTYASVEDSSDETVHDESMTAQDASRTHKKRIE